MEEITKISFLSDLNSMIKFFQILVNNDEKWMFQTAIYMVLMSDFGNKPAKIIVELPTTYKGKPITPSPKDAGYKKAKNDIVSFLRELCQKVGFLGAIEADFDPELWSMVVKYHCPSVRVSSRVFYPPVEDLNGDVSLL